MPAAKPIASAGMRFTNPAPGVMPTMPATGARLTTTLANEMTRRNARHGLISVCAQGGLGFAMVLER